MGKNNNINPWLASSTYTEDQAYKFRGREKDTEKILTMLQQNDCVVCYGASGNGKSSVINAGVSPAMRKIGLFPINITFFEDDLKNVEVNFEEFIFDKINDAIEAHCKWFKDHNDKADDYHVEFVRLNKYEGKKFPQSLWWKLRTEIIQVQVPFGKFDYIPVIILDQFEEIFSAPWKAEFFKWLETLCRDVCPDDTQNLGAEVDIPYNKLFKLLVSLRYEYLAELDDWCSQKVYIPQIMQNRYYLRPLSREQATEVITQQPISKNSIEFCKTLNSIKIDILNFIDSKNNGEVEPVILSVLCYRLYEYALINGISELKSNHLDNYQLPTVIKDFYKAEMQKINLSKRNLNIFEHKLVEDDAEQAKRNRIKTKELQAIAFDKYREDLEKKHIIRITQFNKDEYVELVHDTIASVIVEMWHEASKKKKILFTRIGIVLAFIGIFCFTYWNQLWTYDQKKTEHFPYMELRDSTIVATTKQCEGNCRNKFELQTLLCDTLKHDCCFVSNCPELEIIDATSYPSSKISLFISDCEKLKFIKFSNKLSSLTLEIAGSPAVRQIELPDNLSTLDLTATSDKINFKVGSNNKNFIWDNGILWDVNKDSIIYAQFNASTNIVPLEFSTKEKYIYNTSRNFETGVRLVKWDTLFHRINNIYIPRNADSIDLSQYNVTHIGLISSESYRNFKELKYVKLPKGLTNIYSSTFAGCTKLETIEFDSTSTVSISSNAFTGCDNLKSIIFPKDVRLSLNAFHECKSLEKVVFREKAIMNYGAFHDCQALSHVVLPENLELGGIPFLGCPIKKFEYDHNFWEEMEDGTIISKDSSNVFLADLVDYHTFSKGEYHSKQGKLYKGETLVNVPFKIATSDAMTIIYNGYKMYNNNVYETEIFLPSSKFAYNGSLGIIMLTRVPINLEKLHIPYSNAVDLSTIDYSLTDSIKSNVTLFVPYGCLKYFSSKPSYKSFKEIKEETLLTTLGIIIIYHYNVGIWFVNFYDLWWLVYLLIIMVPVGMGFFSFYRIRKEGHNLTQKQIVGIFLKSVLAVILGFFFYWVIYWFLFLTVIPWIHLYSLWDQPWLIVTLAFVLALIMVFYVLYSEGFSLKELINKIKVIGKTIKQMFVAARKAPKKAARILVLVILPFIMLFAYKLYNDAKTEKHNEAKRYVEKAIENSKGQYDNDDALNILYSAWKQYYSTIKGDTIEDKLYDAVFSRMIKSGLLVDVDTLMKSDVSDIFTLSDGRLLFHKYDSLFVYNKGKKTPIYKASLSIKSIQANLQGTDIAFIDGSNLVTINLSTCRKDTIERSKSINAFAFHPTKPIIAYAYNYSNVIYFYDLQMGMKDKINIIPLSSALKNDGLNYSKSGNDLIAATMDKLELSAYHWDNKWENTQIPQIRGIYPLYISNHKFSLVRNDSLILWPEDKIGVEAEKMSWHIMSNNAKKSFSSDGKYALISDDHKIKILDLSSTNKEILNLDRSYILNGACLSEDGKSFYVSCWNDIVKIPILTHEQLYERMRKIIE